VESLCKGVVKGATNPWREPGLNMSPVEDVAES
jgi:hypothetical protein